jgi:large subunit ribosomal protein L31
MKTTIHPVWHDDAVVTCACGETWTTGSTQKSIVVDICSNCHPFFTGEMRFVDVQGRVEKFKAKQKAADDIRYKKKEITPKKPERPQTLKEMLTQRKSESKTS